MESPMHLEGRIVRSELEVMFVDRALGMTAMDAVNRRRSHSALVGALTTKEMRVLEFLDHGATNKEMSKHLFVTENTIKYHLKNIYGKLQVTNRLQALIAARDLGLIETA